MIDPISVAGSGAADLSPIYVAGDAPNAELGQRHVDPSLSTRFEELLMADDLRVAEANKAMEPGLRGNASVEGAIADGWVKPLPGPAEAVPAPTVMDSMAETIQTIREDWMSMRSEMADARVMEEYSTEQLLRMLADVSQTSLTVNLLVQEMSAFNQSVNQLMKAQ